MDRSHLHRLLALAVGVAVTAVIDSITAYPLLAIMNGVCWGVGVAITLRRRRLRPTNGGLSWGESRWLGLCAVLVAGAAFLGVSTWLPVSVDLRLGLQLLVAGAAFVGYATASMARTERQLEDSSRSRQTTVGGTAD